MYPKDKDPIESHEESTVDNLIGNALALLISFHIISAILIFIVGLFSDEAAITVCDWTVCGFWSLFN